jgi:glycosyltransferase involved in cell wall biosynthesis
MSAEFIKKPSVLVTFDSMKDTNCGYYSFGKGLGDSLISENHGRYNLSFYLFETTKYFNGKINILRRSILDNLFFSSKNKFDVVHFSDQTCRLRPWRVNAKKIMTIHDMNKVHLKHSRQGSINRYLKRLGKRISEVDRVVAISQFVANDVINYFPEAASKLSVIYNGADKLVLDDNHIPGIVPQKPFIFTIGLLSVQKGFHLLPALLAGNDYMLVISGIETPHKAKIIEEGIKYNCLDRIIITGPVTDADKAWYYKNCLAFVFPSIAEGFGLPVIEALHFGKPVFLSRYTSLPEVGGDAAYYFNSFDASHMQEIFNKGLLDFVNRARSNEMVKQANKFSWDKAAGEYLNLYEECINASVISNL